MNQYRQNIIQRTATDQIPLQPIREGQRPTSETQDAPPPRYEPRGNTNHGVVSQHLRSLFSFSGRNASPHRRSVARLVLHLTYPLLVLIAILTILPLSATIFTSQQEPPELTEWAVCGHRLGIWVCIWAGLLFLFCVLRCWGFVLERRVRHQYPEDMYATWDSPNPLSGMLPQRPTKRTTDIISTSAAPSDDRMALPEVREIEYYLSLMALFLMTACLWVIIVALRLLMTHECLESSPHIWGLAFVIFCVQALMLFLVALLWLFELYQRFKL